MSGHLFFFILVLFCSNIATKSTYQFSKCGVQPFASYRKNGWENSAGTSFDSSSLILVLFCSNNYSYEIHLPIFETWRAAVRKLQDFRWKMGGKTLLVQFFTRFLLFLFYFVLI